MQWPVLSTEIETITVLRFEGCHANFSDSVINTFMVISFGLSHYLSTWQKKGGFCMCWGRGKVGIGECTCMHTRGGPKQTLRAFIIVFERHYLQFINWLDCLSRKPQVASCFCFPRAGITAFTAISGFSRVHQGSEQRCTCFCSRDFYQLSHLSGPSDYFCCSLIFFPFPISFPLLPSLLLSSPFLLPFVF